MLGPKRLIGGIFAVGAVAYLASDPFARITLYSQLTGGAGVVETYHMLQANDKVRLHQALDEREWSEVVAATKSPSLGLRSMAASDLFALYNRNVRRDEIKGILLALTSDPEPSMRSLAYSQLILRCRVPESRTLLAKELQDPDQYVQRFAQLHKEDLDELDRGIAASGAGPGWHIHH